MGKIRGRFSSLAVLLAVGFLAERADACSASSTIDKARASKDTDQYKAARDVAEEFIDQEKFVRDEATIDATVGTLLREQDGWTWGDGSRRAVSPQGGGRTADGWRAVLDEPSGYTHGRAATGADSGSPTVRDHLRLHGWEMDQLVRGEFTIRTGDDMDLWVRFDKFYRKSGTRAPAIPDWARDSSQWSQWSTPAPYTPPSAAAPAPPPAVPATDHAG